MSSAASGMMGKPEASKLGGTMKASDAGERGAVERVETETVETEFVASGPDHLMSAFRSLPDRCNGFPAPARAMVESGVRKLCD